MFADDAAFRLHASPVQLAAPLAGVAVAALVGCSLAAVPFAAGWWMAVGLMVVGLGMAWRGSAALRRAGMLLVYTCAWYMWATPAFRPWHPHALQQQMPRPRVTVTAEGWVRADPAPLPGRAGATDRWRVPVELTHWHVLPEKQPVRGQVTVWTEDSGAADLRVGDRLRLFGVVRTGAGPGAGLRLSVASMEVLPGDLTVRPGSGGPWLLRLADRTRRACARILSRGLEERHEVRTVWLALLLGYRHDLSEPLERLFSDTGTFHLFAISGLHVGIVAVILATMARLLGRSAAWRAAWVVPGLVLFAACTGFRASTVRAVIMAAVWFLAPALRRRPHGLSAWSVAVILVLGWSPAQVTDLGFRFSFGIVLGLMLLYRPLTRPWLARLSTDPWAVEVPWWQRGLRDIARYAVGVAGLSLCAWVVSTPLMALWFGRLAPGGLLANLVVVPLAFVAVSSGLAACATAWCPPLSAMAVQLGAMAVEAMLYTVEGVSGLPGTALRVGSPPLLLVLGWYAWLGVVGWRGRTGCFAWVLAAVLLTSAFAVEHHRRQQVQVTVFDQGGAGTVLLQHRGRAVLIDPGPAMSASYLLRRLERQSVDHVDVLVLTTGLSGQIGAAPALLHERRVGAVWLPGSEPLPRGFRHAVRAAQAAGVPVVSRLRGDHQEIIPGVWSEVLHPGRASHQGPAGDTALVLRLSQGPHALLVEGAASGWAHEDLLLAPLNLTTTWWVTSTSNDRNAVPHEWVRALWAEQMLVPRGAQASFFAPRTRRLERLTGSGDIRLLSETGPLSGALGGELRSLK